MPRPIAEVLDQLIELVEQHNQPSFVVLARTAGLDPTRDFLGASLVNVDFRGEDLRGFNFAGADLTGCDFRGAVVTDVCFDGATLVGAIGLARSSLVPSRPFQTVQSSPSTAGPRTTVRRQRTIRSRTGCRGMGLHTGQPVTMGLRPGKPDSGIIFRRLDLGADIPAHWSKTIATSLSTVISDGEGAVVHSIEALMAALAGSEIDNVIVELDGPEVPIMDGSAAPFVELIERAGSVPQEAPRRGFKILKPVCVVEEHASAALMPELGFSMSFEIDFDNPVIRRQDISLSFERGTFNSEIAAARTFGMLDDLPRLKAAGLARGGSLENTVVVSGDRVLNGGGLRFADEFVRHKLLDAFGDLYLAGGPIIGHFHGIRSGHSLTRQLLAMLFADEDAWTEMFITEGNDLGVDQANFLTRRSMPSS